MFFVWAQLMQLGKVAHAMILKRKGQLEDQGFDQQGF